MYNMNISILGYKLSLEILILIGVIYLILVGHTLCGCCNMGGIMEGLTTAAASAIKDTTPAVGVGATPPAAQSAAAAQRQAERQKIKHNIAERQQIRQNIKAHAATTPATPVTTPVSTPATTTEGFVGANTNYGESSSYSLSSDIPINTSSWTAPNMTVKQGQQLSAGVKSILNRQSQPIPLPDGEMLMFANTEFKPECCPNAYSTSTGCACMTTDQYNYLVLRGGNNVPYSEY